MRLVLGLAMLAAGATLLGAAAAHGGDNAASIRRDGTFHVTMVGRTGNIDPALVDADPVMFALLDATCARLMTYPNKKPPRGYRLQPEVAARPPLVSRDGKTYTFVLRRGFRFSDKTPVRADSFAWAITRTLQLETSHTDATNGGGLVKDIVGAQAVAEGKAQSVRGISVPRPYRLVIRLIAAAPEFPARITGFCALPRAIDADPEGWNRFPAAGPYFVAQNVRGRKIVLKRNPYYGGSRPQRVSSIVADGLATSNQNVLDRIGQGRADWGGVPPVFYWGSGLVSRYGINKSQFWVRPGLTLVHYPLNTRRPLFRGNPKLRRAVSFAIDRRAVRRALLGGASGGRLTDQYLPHGFPGFRDVRIYPPKGNVRTARALAHGNLRSGKAVLITLNSPPLKAGAQVIKRNLKRIGLDVEVEALPGTIYFPRIAENRDDWDIAWAVWAPDHFDPYAYLNALFDPRFTASNLGSFNEPRYSTALRQANTKSGQARDRAYARLDAQLARYAVPTVAIQFTSEPTFVSKRVDKRCLGQRATIDLAVVCLKR